MPGVTQYRNAVVRWYDGTRSPVPDYQAQAFFHDNALPVCPCCDTWHLYNYVEAPAPRRLAALRAVLSGGEPLRLMEERRRWVPERCRWGPDRVGWIRRLKTALARAGLSAAWAEVVPAWRYWHKQESWRYWPKQKSSRTETTYAARAVVGHAGVHMIAVTVPRRSGKQRVRGAFGDETDVGLERRAVAEYMRRHPIQGAGEEASGRETRP